MGQEPEVIEHDIASSREDLSRNLDALADRVSPGRVVGRKVDSAKGRLSSVKDTVMGTASSMTDAPQNAAGSVSDAASKVGQRAEGNPLAAGLIAFGAGWLVSSLIPPSDAEAKLAGQAVDAAKEHGQPLVEHARSVGQEVGNDLKDEAAQAATEVKDSAAESVDQVKTEGQSAATDLRSDLS